MNDDGRGEGGRARLARGTKPQALTGHRELAGPVPASVDARGSGPVATVGETSGDRPAAQSIREAVEQLIEAKEADEAIAEWMRDGG
ncbi:MAG TPA: hypothetical protein VHW23_07155 [Kofleriaceae bacterium]|jgi:hypothetical protein|nr:hypothetical protein [Kofleriaceae bacterium]